MERVLIRRVTNGFTLQVEYPDHRKNRVFIANDENEVLAIVACLLVPKEAEIEEDEDEHQGELFPYGDSGA